MAIVIPYVGEVSLLGKIATAYTWHIHLFKNNFTPVEGSVLGDFTEADFSGYSALTFSWTVPVTVAATSYLVGYPAAFWQQNNPGGTANTIYGYYITDYTETVLLWAELLGTPKSMAGLADMLTVVPRVELSDD